MFCLLISSLLAVGGQPGKANPAVKAEDVKSSTNIVVMLGDSTTECSGNKPGERLTDLVQAYLTKEHIPASVVNSGIGSATAKIGLSRLKDQVLVHDPALVTISFGLNDTGRSNPEEYRQCLEKMVLSIQTNTHAKILLVTSTPFINERHQWRGQFTAKGGIDAALDTKFCSVMRLLAKENNLPLCDLHAHFTAQFEKNPKLRDEFILPDGVHLTDKGNEVAAQYLAPAVATLLAKSANRETADNQKFPVGIPYPEALDKAAVHQTKISDLNREGLLVGNGDLNGLLYERDGCRGQAGRCGLDRLPVPRNQGAQPHRASRAGVPRRPGHVLLSGGGEGVVSPHDQPDTASRAQLDDHDECGQGPLLNAGSV